MEKFYQEYGKFIIHFENICFQLNHSIRRICTKGKMFGEEDKNIEILLQGLTANPILMKFKCLFLTTEYSKNEEILNMIEIFYQNFSKVIEYRNFIAHGTFFIGDPHGNINKFQIRNPKLNKKGFYSNTNILDIRSLEKLNDELLSLETFIDYFNSYINKHNHQFKEKIYEIMKSSIIDLSINLDVDAKSLQV